MRQTRTRSSVGYECYGTSSSLYKTRIQNAEMLLKRVMDAEQSPKKRLFGVTLTQNLNLTDTREMRMQEFTKAIEKDINSMTQGSF